MGGASERTLPIFFWGGGKREEILLSLARYCSCNLTITIELALLSRLPESANSSDTLKAFGNASFCEAG